MDPPLANRDHRCTGGERQAYHAEPTNLRPHIWVFCGRAFGIDNNHSISGKHFFGIFNESILRPARSTGICFMEVISLPTAGNSKSSFFAKKCGKRPVEYTRWPMYSGSRSEIWLTAKIMPVSGRFS